MAITIRPATPDLWPALDDLFGRAGASNGCWCMYWRLGRGYTRRPRDANRADLRALVASGPPPGLVALDGSVAVGWCQLAPRAALPWLEARVARHVDPAPVWALSCFYVRRSSRRTGVMSRLIGAAVASAAAARAGALEAYPVDTSVRGSSRNLFTGTAAAFRSAGFRKVGSLSESRPIMRIDLG